jgi:Cytochrome C oxidase, cbb3-type, subunit III
MNEPSTAQGVHSPNKTVLARSITMTISRTTIVGGIAVVAAVVATTIVTVSTARTAHAAAPASSNGSKGKKGLVDRGRYVINIAGCNDCHTPMYGQKGGDVAEQDRLMGTDVGFLGPWGTSYGKNLRRTVERMTERQWVDYVRKGQFLPPMPGWVFRDMSVEDIRAVYAYLSWLGPDGEEAPAPLPPGEIPSTPFIEFVPKFPKH